MVTRGIGHNTPRRRYFIVLFCSLIAVFGVSRLARAQQQNIQDYWSDRRLTAIESQNLDARLRVVESDMFEVKWLTRTVTATLIGQFILAGISLRRKS